MAGEPFKNDYAYLIVYAKDHALIDDLQLSIRVTSQSTQSQKKPTSMPQKEQTNEAADSDREDNRKPDAEEEYLKSFMEQERIKQS